METIKITNAEALAVTEANLGYRLDDERVAVIAVTPEGRLLCVAAVQVDADGPVTAVDRMRDHIEAATPVACEFIAVSKNAGHVLALQEAGQEAVLGVSDDVELAFLADRVVAPSRDDMAGLWSPSEPVEPATVTWSQDTLQSRQEALQALQGQLSGPSSQSEKISLLLAALAGPVWLRDAVMTWLGMNLAAHEELLRQVARATDDVAVLAPVAFALLMGGDEAAARILTERVDPADDTSLLGLVRQALESGQAHQFAQVMLTDQMINEALQTGLS